MGNAKVTSFHMSISKIPLLVFNRYSRWTKRLFHWLEWQVISGRIYLKCFSSLKILSEQIVNGLLFMLLNDPQCWKRRRFLEIVLSKLHSFRERTVKKGRVHWTSTRDGKIPSKLCGWHFLLGFVYHLQIVWEHLVGKLMKQDFMACSRGNFLERQNIWKGCPFFFLLDEMF